MSPTNRADLNSHLLPARSSLSKRNYSGSINPRLVRRYCIATGLTRKRSAIAWTMCCCDSSLPAFPYNLSTDSNGISNAAANWLASVSSRCEAKPEFLARRLTLTVASTTSGRPRCKTQCPISCAMVKRCLLSECASFTAIITRSASRISIPDVSSANARRRTSAPRLVASSSTGTGGFSSLNFSSSSCARASGPVTSRTQDSCYCSFLASWTIRW